MNRKYPKKWENYELIYHANPAMPFDKVYEFCQKYGWKPIYPTRKLRKQYKEYVKQHG